MVQKLLLAVILVLTLVGCISIQGNVFKDSNFNRIRVGMMEQEIIELLGPPNSISDIGNGTYLLQWIYVYGTGIGIGGGRHVALLFGADGRLIKIQHQFKTGPGL
jgi:outer membrane protein assembly factor BamE (lipoprotein component of BamABCDE complex)